MKSFTMSGKRKRGNLLTVAMACLLVMTVFPVDPAAGQDCGCMDVVLVMDDTGSMGPTIDTVKSGLGEILSTALAASGGDLRMGLVSFKDDVEVDWEFTDMLTDVEGAVNSLAASLGNLEPEASDEALRYAVTGTTSCDLSGRVPLGGFRPDCVKIAVLITDARPGGCDDLFVAGVDDMNAAAVADQAAQEEVLISAVLVPFYTDHLDTIRPIMMNYADATGGVFNEVAPDGSGTGLAIEEILEACGTTGQMVPVDVDIKPGSCPNPLRTRSADGNGNARMKGVLPAAILGTEDFDVTTVDPATLGLTRDGVEGEVSPIRYSYEDVATPFEGELCDCHELGGDGYLDLTVKFSRDEAAEVLGLVEEEGSTLPLKIVGNISEEYGGAPIMGEDCIWILPDRTR